VHEEVAAVARFFLQMATRCDFWLRPTSVAAANECCDCKWQLFLTAKNKDTRLLRMTAQLDIWIANGRRI